MLSRKWHTLNHNCQKFNAIYKRCGRLSKIGENELDVMKWARTTYRDKNKNTPFTQEDALEVLRAHSKWDAPAPAPVDLTEDEYIPAVNTDELFGPGARPRPPSKQRPKKKTKSDTSASTGESSSSSQFGEISELLTDFRDIQQGHRIVIHVVSANGLFYCIRCNEQVATLDIYIITISLKKDTISVEALIS
ncbi:hypothetical protein Tco_0946974 [Tanacetum coccineum]